jgi:uncharacterized membrane protein HdeD (DUF308 family)
MQSKGRRVKKGNPRMVAFGVICVAFGMLLLLPRCLFPIGALLAVFLFFAGVICDAIWPNPRNRNDPWVP